MAQPRVTIGLPVFNSETYLSESLDSLLNQTYGDFKLIISDNASTDGTADICQEYAKRDSRIQYHRNSENIGMAPNFNLVASRADTPWFKWASADDLSAPTLLEEALPVIEADSSIVLCYPKTILLNSVEGTEEKYDDNLHLMQDDPIPRFIHVVDKIGLCNVTFGLIRMEVLRQTNMLKSFPGADLAFVAELSLYGKFCELPSYLFYRRLHPQASSWSRNDSEHQNRRFHSERSRGTSMNRWRTRVEHFRAVRRSPLSLREKLFLGGDLVRQMYWERGWLMDELRSKIRLRSRTA